MRKQFKLVFPENMAINFAKFCFENSIMILLSYAKDEFLSGLQITAIVAATEGDEEKKLTDTYKQYIKP